MKKGSNRSRSLAGLVGMILVIAICGVAYAVPSYLSQFTAIYPAAAGTQLNSCGLCHMMASGAPNPAGGGTRNSYGNDWSNANYDFAAVEGLDSDGDSYTNLAEINAGTYPGYAASFPAAPPPPPPPPPAADTTPPTITAFMVPSTATTLTIGITTLTASDNVAVTGYMVTGTATAPAASATGWSATAPTSYTFTSTGAKTLYAWAKDAAGNVSASLSAIVTVPATASASSPPDILWRNTATGQNAVWYMNGATFVSGATLNTLGDPSWTIGGMFMTSPTSAGGSGSGSGSDRGSGSGTTGREHGSGRD